MNGIVSGRAGVALLFEGDTYYSLHAHHPEVRIPRRSTDYPHLFRDAGDLEFLEDIGEADVRRRLGRAARREAALDQILLLLDAELSHDLRSRAVRRLDELLAEPGAAQELDKIMYARPLPKSADAIGALTLCRAAGAAGTENFLIALTDRQAVIHKVRRAWDALPVGVCGSEEEKGLFERASLADGVFRAIADILVDPERTRDVDPHEMDLTHLRRIPEYDEILRHWLTAAGLTPAAAGPHFAADSDGLRVASKGILRPWRVASTLAVSILFLLLGTQLGRFCFPYRPGPEVVTAQAVPVFGPYRGRDREAFVTVTSPRDGYATIVTVHEEGVRVLPSSSAPEWRVEQGVPSTSDALLISGEQTHVFIVVTPEPAKEQLRRVLVRGVPAPPAEVQRELRVKLQYIGFPWYVLNQMLIGNPPHE